MTARRPSAPRPGRAGRKSAPPRTPAQGVPRPAAAAAKAARPAAKPARTAAKPPRTARPGTRPAARTAARATSRRTGGGRGPALLRPTTMLAGAVVILALLVAPSVGTWVGQRQQLAAQQQEVADLRRRVDALAAERDRWKDPAFVRAQAGERLDFVMPGQTRYRLLDDDATGADEPDPRLRAVAAAAADGAPWYTTVWQSARMAGDVTP